MIRDETAWKTAKALVVELGGVLQRVLRDLALNAYHQRVMALAGMPM